MRYNHWVLISVGTSSAEYYEHINFKDMNDPSEVHRTVQVLTFDKKPS